MESNGAAVGFHYNVTFNWIYVKFVEQRDNGSNQYIAIIFVSAFFLVIYFFKTNLFNLSQNDHQSRHQAVFLFDKVRLFQNPIFS